MELVNAGVSLQHANDLARSLYNSDSFAIDDLANEASLVGSNLNVFRLSLLLQDLGRHEPRAASESIRSQTQRATRELIDSQIQRAIEESIRITPPVSACRLPSEPVPGDGTCVVCMEATAEMLLRDSKGAPSCSHVCMCEYCANEMGKSDPKCPMCRKKFVVPKLHKLHIERPEPTPPPTPPPSKPSPRARSKSRAPPDSARAGKSPRRRKPGSRRRSKRPPRTLPPLHTPQATSQ